MLLKAKLRLLGDVEIGGCDGPEQTSRNRFTSTATKNLTVSRGGEKGRRRVLAVT